MLLQEICTHLLLISQHIALLLTESVFFHIDISRLIKKIVTTYC